MIIVVIIIALIIIIGQLESNRNSIEAPRVYHYHTEETTYYVNDKKVTKQEFENSLKYSFK